MKQGLPCQNSGLGWQAVAAENHMRQAEVKAPLNSERLNVVMTAVKVTEVCHTEPLLWMALTSVHSG